jgi:hypothetical protein
MMGWTCSSGKGEEKCIQNVGEKEISKAATWKTEQEMRG